ncbi:GntR family transcriptional regulator [Xanthobacter dioxanivorans]|uniref:GntR family transcriptional regulator n=1 Tax=Xanthobacter dioxanivorans TaxID=2528964 RepID=A0A974PSH3_9HYPH|nr:GntR family transcriptional regulator [Xanthobacter dioxanivorans]QRG08880.1 GntR family transcriptional regulator [Xanthobacter dioxanivorans]
MREKKISRVQEELAAKIIDFIRRENLPAGYHLTESQLVDEFGVSRSPIRAALTVLAEKGVVTATPNRGHYLAQGAEALADLELDGSPSDVALYDRIARDRMRDKVPEQFTEAAFMRRYRVSRAQLVRTLTRLTQDGLVQRGNGHRWVFLAVLNSAEAYDASYRFRALIEPAGLLEPTFKLDEALLDRSRHAHEQILKLAKAGDLKGRDVFEVNAEFHEILASMSGNPFILQGVRQQNRLRRLSEYYAYDDSDRIEILIQEHFKIMDVLRSGDREWAATLLRRHLEIARRLPPPFDNS